MSLIEVLKKGNYTLIDVREPMELDVDGSIEGAINIPLGEVEMRKDEILSLKGDVVVAIRPENAILSDDGEITGKVYSKFYLGDCNDLRVEIGNGNILRIIARASTYNTLNEGDEVKVKILDYFVFEDDGKDQIKIMT